MTVKEASVFFGKSEQFIREAIKTGLLPGTVEKCNGHYTYKVGDTK